MTMGHFLADCAKVKGLVLFKNSKKKPSTLDCVAEQDGQISHVESPFDK